MRPSAPGRQFTVEELRESTAMRAPLTKLAYASDMRIFRAWCEQKGCGALPASTEEVCRYITDQLNTGRRVTTVARYMTAIIVAHRDAGIEKPNAAEIKLLITAAKRLRREQPVQKQPVSLQQLRDISAQTSGPGAIQARDRSLVLFGFASALRRSNLAALDLADVQFTHRGLIVTIRQEKQDQFGRGRVLGVPPGRYPETCALQALIGWLAVRGQRPGPLFQQTRCGKATGLRLHPARVALILKAQIAALGYDAKAYGAHSMRSGFVTAAVEANVNTFAIMGTTGHRSIETLRRYFRTTDPLRAPAATHIDM